MEDNDNDIKNELSESTTNLERLEKIERVSSLSTKSKGSKSKSRSPEKSAKSNKSGKTIIKSGKSKSPKRKLTGSQKDRKSDIFNESSLMSNEPKSTPELEDLSSQGLTAINTKIFQKITLKKLILSGNNLRSLPAAVADLINLEYLDISRNPLRVKDVDDSKCLPIEMRLMKNLKFLSISECNLRYIPTNVWLCVSLNILDLSRNKICLLVPDIGNLQELTNLNLSQCNLTTLPAEIGFCSNLVEIILMANQIESLPDTLKDCSKLKYLKMSYRSFSSLLDSYMENLISKGQIKSEHVPVVVFELENLEILDLKHTKINNLPENNLKNLAELCVDFNYFDNFTESSLKPMYESLKILTMSNNLLKEMPNEILNLVNLEILDLSYNQITALPVKLNLKNLKQLYLNNNHLNSINRNISFLKSLEKLNLENNNLTDLTEGIFELTNLTYLDLSNNKITRISPKICNLKSIKEAHSFDKLNKIGLWVIGNPLKIPPKEIWQTSNIKKIFEFLSSYNQRNLDYVFYSKLIFMGCSGVGKSSLIDCFYNNRVENELADQIDHRTVVARKLYKRTVNKVEWLILDLGGHEIYKCLHSTFLSSIDHENEPTIFVLVYNHSDYTTENHEEFLGSWIDSILAHNVISIKVPLQIKIIGIVNKDYDLTSEEHNEKIKLVQENCKLTTDSYNDKLLGEKKIIDALLNATGETSENKLYLNEAKSKIDIMIKRKVIIDENISIVKSSFSKEYIEKVMNSLETLTIRNNKGAPLDLKIVLKDHFAKLKANSIEFSDLISSIQTNNNIQALIRTNRRFDFNAEKIINYAKTIGEIFWLKFNKKLNKLIYLRYDYILMCLKMFIRHNLLDELENNKSVFKTCGIFKNEREYDSMVDTFRKYGIVQHGLIKFICFSANQLKQHQIEEVIDLLRDFSIIYKSNTQYVEEKCSFFQIIAPSLGTANYEKEKSLKTPHPRNWNIHLYLNDYHRFFIRLDQIRRYREEVKEYNALKKQKEMWNSQETDMFQTDILGGMEDAPFEDPRILTFNNMPDSIINIEPVKFNIVDENGFYKFIDEEEYAKKYLHKCLFELQSPFKIETHFFHKLSALVQDLTYERFDWIDTIVARDIDQTCIKIKIDNSVKNDHKVIIEIIGIEMESLNNLKDQFNLLFESLFDHYPGSFFIRNFSTIN